MSIAPGITVNGINISIEQINNEVQYHPAASMFDAKYEAMQALVIKELLIQKAAEKGMCERDDIIQKPDSVIESLLEQELSVPDADDETCSRFYDNNMKQFFTSPLFEAAHILYPAPPSDEDARKECLEKAQKALGLIKKNPAVFETIAKDESACSSSSMGGHLGQITKGQTTPAFEDALFHMQEGDISNEPVESEFGYHLIKVHKRIQGKQLPYDAVKGWISDYLRQQSWQRAFGQYVQLLAGESKISGFQLKQSDSPLVQ